MANHNQLGKQGEELAATFLTTKGYHVMHQHWRHSHYEIDIIATRNNKVHFVEVKSRSSKTFGFPEESVSKKKFRYLCLAADEFLYKHPQYKHIQFDILSINKLYNGEVEYFLIEDVYL